MSSGVRFAILVNDFGDLNIDASLIASHEGETISLTNGCICCNMVDGFVETMIKLMKRIDKFDQIVMTPRLGSVTSGSTDKIRNR